MKEKYQELSQEINQLWRYLWLRYKKERTNCPKQRTNQRKLLAQ